jgi:Na+/H+ antiporter NhaD/arsenite permease-like protein
LPSHERPRGAPLPPEVAAIRRRRFKSFLWSLGAFLLIGAAVGGVPVLSGHGVTFLEWVGAIMVLGIGQVIAVAQAEKRARPRPRWHYLLFSLGFIVAAVGLALTAGRTAHHHNELSALLAGAAIFASTGALLAAARGSLRGRLRRAMWRFPPPWLAIAEAEEAKSRDEDEIGS